MHDDETIDVCAQLLRYGGAHVTDDGAAAAAAADAFVDGNLIDGCLQEEQLFDYTGAAAVPVEDVAVGMGGGGVLALGDDDVIASDIDDFFNGFLEAEAAGTGASAYEMDVMNEDFPWLDNQDAFLPPPLPSPAAGVAPAEQELPPAGAQGGGVATTPAEDVAAPEAVPMQDQQLQLQEQPDVAAPEAVPMQGQQLQLQEQPQLVPQTWHVADEVTIDVPVGIIHDLAAPFEPVAPVAVAPPSAMTITGAGGERTRGEEGASPAGGKGEGRGEEGVGVAGGGLFEKMKYERRQKVARYLEKKKRRKWTRASSYQSRQHVANSRPRVKGRFVALESEFLSVAELQRRKREQMKKMQEMAAAAEERQYHQDQEGVVGGSRAAGGGQVSI